MKKITGFLKHKKESKDPVIVPCDIRYRYEEGNESDKPILFIAFMTGEEEATVVVLDADAASQLSLTLNASPMKMFMRTEKELRDMMYQ